MQEQPDTAKASDIAEGNSTALSGDNATSASMGSKPTKSPD